MKDVLPLAVAGNAATLGSVAVSNADHIEQWLRILVPISAFLLNVILITFAIWRQKKRNRDDE